MTDRPYTLLSAAMSLDGYLDGGRGRPLALSNAADLDRVDAVRAGCDAILVGAGTVRGDDPRLVVRSPQRQAERASSGRPPTPLKVTVTSAGALEASAAFFRTEGVKLVYCASGSAAAACSRLGDCATVVDGGEPVDLRFVTEDLYGRGIRRLLVEGGRSIHTQFLTADLADELHLVVAPFFVGSGAGTRFVDSGAFPWHPGRRARLAEVRQLGDVVLLRYALSPRFGEHDREEC